MASENDIIRHYVKWTFEGAGDDCGFARGSTLLNFKVIT